MRCVRPTVLLVALASAGCGAAHAPVRYGRENGDTHGVPSMAALPALDAAGYTDRMRHGLALAADTFAIELPAPPAETRGGALQAWTDGPLAEFVGRKSTALGDARHELDAAADESSTQRILGGAVVGLMYEDAGRALRGIPLPAELSNEPLIAETFRDVVAAQASPYVEEARRAYHACAENARIHEDGRFAHFCDGRRRALPEEYESHATDHDRIQADMAE